MLTEELSALSQRKHNLQYISSSMVAGKVSKGGDGSGEVGLEDLGYKLEAHRKRVHLCGCTKTLARKDLFSH